MGALLALAALLLLVSGVVKLRAAARVGLGLPPLALLEVLAGLALGAVTVAAPPPPGRGLAFLAGATALVVISSVRVGMAVRRQQRLRTASEGARLATYLKYLSREHPPPE